jgi:hypothetical protein
VLETGVGGHLSLVAVLEVPAGDAVDERRCGEQDGRRGSLLDALPGKGVEGGLDLGGHRLELVVQEVGADRARHHGVRGDRVVGPPPGRLDSEEHVGGLGLPVRQPGVVSPSLEVDVVEDDR